MAQTKQEIAEVRSYLIAIGTFLIALFGLSTVFVIGYTSSIPREAFLVFGRHLFLGIGVEAGFRAAFALLTAKAMLILIAVFVALTGGMLTAFKSDYFKKIAKKTDDLAINIAAAPLKFILILAGLVFWVRFLHFSFESLVIIGGWFIFGIILFETSDRVLLRKLIELENENVSMEINNYKAVRLILLGTLISVFAYSMGVAAERHTRSQEVRVLSERLDQPGIVFGAGDIGLLIYVPGEITENLAGGFLEVRQPSTWYMLPFNGDPLELR